MVLLVCDRLHFKNTQFMKTWIDKTNTSKAHMFDSTFRLLLQSEILIFHQVWLFFLCKVFSLVVSYLRVSGALTSLWLCLLIFSNGLWISHVSPSFPGRLRVCARTRTHVHACFIPLCACSVVSDSLQMCMCMPSHMFYGLWYVKIATQSKSKFFFAGHPSISPVCG